MMRDARHKQFDLLLVHELDRLGRDRELAVLTKATLRRRGIQVQSVVENLSDSTQDRMFEGMMELFSDFYSQNLAEETRKGQRPLVRNGLWAGGKVP
jgi:site-specific DNA recombinase